jgi:hypothetical protein
MASDQIRYDLLTQEALRGVIRRVLADVARDGVPGDHHFYVTFKTGARGVRVSQRLRQTYPDEMTIVLQHQYWDLAPGETFFTVTLQFSGQPKRLSIPYAAVTRFYDPSVQFLLQFEPPAPGPAESRPAPEPEAEPVAEPAGEGGTKVVSLDQFRKK